jgi:hypothetical protein
MFFKSDDITDTRDIYKVLEEDSSNYLVIKSKPIQIKVLPNIEKNNQNNQNNINSKTINNKKNNNKLFNIKVKSKNTIKSQEWYYS